jgi:hypothetical protein
MPTLLERQVDLLEHLTSGGVIYGEGAETSPDQAPPGLDRAMLRLEAVFSHEKRLEKIAAVFPRTFKLLGAGQAAVIRDFTMACPPVGISRLENADQFFDFLSALWQREPPEPDCLRDIAACEFACAQARVSDKTWESESATGEQERIPAIRRPPHVVLRRCSYDIRPVFETAEMPAAVERRDARLAIAVPPDAEHPKVFELLPLVFDLLTAVNDWTDRREFGASPELDELLGELAQHGLIEARL